MGILYHGFVLLVYYEVMVKFISVLGIVILLACAAALLWPRLTSNPRPEPLTRLHDLLVSTSVGSNAANVLGVSDEAQVVPLTPQRVMQQVGDGIKARVTDIIITNVVREIMSKFSQLPQNEQERILDAIGKSMNQTSPAASAAASIKH